MMGMERTVPVLGTTGRMIDCGRRLHRVDDGLVILNLATQIEFAGEGAEWYAVVLRSDGRGVLRGRTEQTPAPPQDVLDRMVELAVLLNRELHYGGHWIVFWADDRMQALYRDGNGHGLAVVNYDDPWPRIAPIPVNDLAERCEKALATALPMMRDHGFRPGEATRPGIRRLH